MSLKYLNMSRTNSHYDFLFMQRCTGIQNIVTEYVTGRIRILEIIHQQIFEMTSSPFSSLLHQTTGDSVGKQ